MYRKLGVFEKATLVANKHAPFNIVSVLKMENAPAPERAREAFASLQQRHPFLRVRIIEDGKAPRFEPVNPGAFQFETVDRSGPDDWRNYTLREMAHRIDHAAGPLFRVVYVYAHGDAELIVNLHHGIADAASGMNLLEEFLELSSGAETEMPLLAPLPATESRFPDEFHRIRGMVNTARYALASMGGMLAYLWHTRNKRTPQVRLGGAGKIATRTLSEELVNQLSRAGRAKRITLNSILNAALLLALNRTLYAGEALPMRTFSFADLRPFTVPPTPEQDLGSYIAMLDYAIDLKKGEDVWLLAARLHAKIYTSLKRRDKFAAVLMSESLLKMMTGMKVMRFGAAALNYTSYVPLKPAYGEIHVTGLHGFVSAFDLGPEISSQARLFNDEIWWDFIYLETDMDANTVEGLLDELVKILKDAVKEGQ